MRCEQGRKGVDGVVYGGQRLGRVDYGVGRVEYGVNRVGCRDDGTRR